MLVDEQQPTVAGDLATRLRVSLRALTVATTGVAEVAAGLAVIAARPHLTTPCHIGAHEGCQIFCMCEDCKTPCECECHLPG